MSYDDRGGSSPRTPYDEPEPTTGDRRVPPTYEASGDLSGYHAPPPRNGAGTTALILGILALLFTITVVLFPLGILLALFAVGLAMVGRSRVKRGHATNRGAATTGLVLGVISLVFGLVLGLLGAVAFQQVRECFDAGMSQSEIRQCIQEQIKS
jgi:hypothetical protein